MISGGGGRNEDKAGGAFYAAFNMHKESLPFVLPEPPKGSHWHVLADTSRPSPQDIHEAGREPALQPKAPVVLPPHTTMLCVALHR